MNFLVVVADQLSPRALPAYGNRVVKAPAISALASSGVVFEHAYCNFPLCAPSRASFITGLLASATGVFDNGAELPASLPTLAHRLRSRGYQTALAGKMHFIGPDQLHGFEQRLTPDIYPAGLNWIPDWSLSLDHTLPWYHDMSSVFGAGVAERSLQLAYDQEVAAASLRAVHDLAGAADERPFLLIASFSQPHDPWEVPAEYWHRYDGVEIDAPRVGHIADDEVDPHTRRVREMCGALGVEVPADVLLNARRAHYASISWVDDQVAALVGALEAEGVRDETVVVFMADHGEMLGERGDWYKMSFFEPSAGVPLIFSAPALFEPHRVTANASLLDLAPTIVELAGADGAGLQGRSLVGQLRGAAPADDAVFSEYLAEGAVAPVVMVKRGALKYIASPADPELLFDLDRDPDELTNVIADKKYLEKVDALRLEVSRRWDLEALDRAVTESQRRRRLVADAMKVGPAPHWDLGDDSGPYVRGEDFWAPFERYRRESS